jgi:FlaA1/EpsC-like NDP-sugar epimerase
MSEHALYSIDRELRLEAQRLDLAAEIVPLLGNAHHKHRVREVMQTFKVQTVYHAAAYKHVPIVETNVAEGVHNNVIATLHTAEAALETGVETFVLVSTDKAVKPTNVMGATKRLAELVLQALHNSGSQTKFCMVRFGNVLDSSGSVVPLFREQIRRGGPVTVTHPEVTRYFMTIPEAAQLVIQAGSMARGGDVFVLDMGLSVRIDDLARRMIGLMGLTVRDASNPDGDIAIEYTGLRPGEKLFEELLIGNNVARTQHPMIMRALEHSLPWGRVHKLVEDLRTSVRNFDCRKTLRLLKEAVVEYEPAPFLADAVAVRRAELGVDVVHASDFPDRRRHVLQAAVVGLERAAVDAAPAVNAVSQL